MRAAGLALALAVLALAACDNGANYKTESGGATEESAGRAAMGGESDMAQSGAAPPAPAAAPRDASTAGPNQPPNQPQNPATPANPAPILYLAYSYFMEAELPPDRLAGLMDAHIKACLDAGPRLCQLVGSNRSGDPKSQIRGELFVRGEPQWLRAFRARLASDSEAEGGRIRQQSTSTEDLTRAIVDTEARLRASRALRDRVQRLLESRPGRLADLLEVERELARVQGEIDATESNLAVMRTRVAMSELRVAYVSQPRAVGSDTFEPLTNALASFVGLVVQGFATIVIFIAAILPAAILIGLILWAVFAIRKRRGGRLIPEWRPPAAAPPVSHPIPPAKDASD